MEVEIPVSFGEWIRQRRRTLDLTQEELARRVGCAAVTIKKIELDERRPSRQMAELLATSLAVPADERRFFIESARGERPTERLLIATPTIVAADPPPALPTPERNNLPIPPTELVGRDELVAQLSQRLLTHNGRLLTLVGPPGIGKTRLALATATTMQATFTDGVYFVPLAAITDTDNVAPAIATEVGLVEAGQSGLPLSSRLIAHLRDKHALLILDNFEQVVGAAPLVAEVLAGAPQVRILVTSQEALRLRAEQRFATPPLTPLAAATLFQQCAQAIDPDFAATSSNQAPIDAICHWLDGVPLAIELIAARVDLLTPQVMLKRLQEQPFHLLNAGARDLPDRHRTLRAALQRSYELLTADEQRLLCRLSVFAGGCELATIEAVCGAGLQQPVIDLLGTLVNRSLVRIATPTDSATAEPRFSLLETIRLFAGEQLQALGEAPAIQAQQVAHFLTLTNASFAIVEGDARQHWFARVERELDNLRAALRYSMAAHDTQSALQLAAGLMGFWSVRSHYEEGRRWLAQALAADPTPTPARAHALFAAGVLAQEQNDWLPARAYLEESLLILRTTSDTIATAEAIQALAWVEYDLRATASAEARFRECLELYRQQKDGEHVAIVLTSLVLLQVEQAQSVDYLAAQRGLQEALGHFHSQQQLDGVAYATYTGGMLALRVGQTAQAIALLQEAVAIFEQQNATRSIAQSSVALGEALRQQGEWLLARQAYERAQAIFQRLQIQQAAVEALLGLGHVARGENNRPAATACYHAALTASAALHDPLLSARAWAGLALVAFAQGALSQVTTQVAEAQRLAGDLPLFLPLGDCAEWVQILNIVSPAV